MAGSQNVNTCSSSIASGTGLIELEIKKKIWSSVADLLFILHGESIPPKRELCLISCREYFPPEPRKKNFRGKNFSSKFFLKGGDVVHG